jgi:hypothetical protein
MILELPPLSISSSFALPHISMVASSSTSATINLVPIREKLNHGNHVLWKAQVLVVLRGAQLIGFLDGANKAPTEKIKIEGKKGSDEETQEVPNPAFELWNVQE